MKSPFRGFGRPNTMPDLATRALDGVRVVEIANERTHYCGKVLAGLGADVLLVEPPGGAPTRGAEPLDEASVGFAYTNAGKRSITLDLDDPGDVRMFRRILQQTDILLTGDVLPILKNRGLTYGELCQENESLVMVSITPFGLTGPLAASDAPDLVCLAQGGLLYLGGYADGAPIAPPQEQALFAGGSFGSVAALIALLHAEATGEGQLADVSLQQCVTMALENSVQFWELEQHVRQRTGGAQKNAGTGLFTTADGYVYVLAAGIGGNRFWPNLVRWMREEGVDGVDALEGDRWGDRDFIASDEAIKTFSSIFSVYVASRSKNEIYERSQHYRVPCAPVNTTSDVLQNEQLRFRGFFTEIELAPGTVAEAPGAPYLLSRTPWTGGLRAPNPGEHTSAVLAELAAWEHQTAGIA
ncbi:CaiB/BaiF CoA transferase family protein [Arthrobacter ginsengisoli]|uniref:CaiB/BaiF CoA transferase family protein n=1 Tax=Arthrobacter ginsengisoli TaxID=1356565 RepID=UPI00286BD511|nr:CaiB/BaiF CoA-transferase family protein [Arthrobacter ginsengisoli]